MADGKNVTLTEGADYRVIYKNNVNAGKGTVIVRGNGIYKGEITQEFEITRKQIKKLKIAAGSVSENVADDLSLLPVYVYDGTRLLEQKKDYTLSDYVSKDARTAQVNITGNGNYKDTVTVKLTVYESGIQIINAENVKFLNDINTFKYTGKPIKPEIKVIVKDAELGKKDYNVKYQNNKDAGTAFVIVTGKGSYKGKAVVPFEITADNGDANALQIKNINPVTYNGKLQKPAVTVSINKSEKAKKLSKNKDYTVTYSNNYHAGKATVTVTGKGNYAGLKAVEAFEIKAREIKTASVKITMDDKADKTNGICLVLKYAKRILKEGTDYEAEYVKADKNKIIVKIKGIGDFTGEAAKTVASLPDTETPDTEKPDYAQQVVELVNIEREKAGLNPLTLDTRVASAAEIRVKEMEKLFSHTRPDGRSCFTVLDDNGISYYGAGENIAMGYATPEQVMNGWMNSEGHRANILNPWFTKIGVGYYKSSSGTKYWTQLFIYD